MKPNECSILTVLLRFSNILNIIKPIESKATGNVNNKQKWKRYNRLHSITQKHYRVLKSLLTYQEFVRQFLVVMAVVEATKLLD